MINGQPNGNGLPPDALFADFTQKRIGAEIHSSAGFGDRHDAGAENISAFGLAEEAGFSPDDIGSQGSLCGIVRQVEAG